MSKTSQIKNIDELAKQLGAGFESPEKLPEELRGRSQKELAELRERQEKAEVLKQQLKNCQPGVGKDKNGKSYWKIYEELCIEILNTTLHLDFKPIQIKPQSRTYKLPGIKKMFRDIILTNNPGIATSVWQELKNDYGCKQIVLECKNTKNEIEAHHVFQLFLYLTNYTGRFGIILSRNGKLHDSAKTAIQKLHLIHSQQYLILVFQDSDLGKMLDYYTLEKNQGEFITEKMQEQASEMPF